MKLYSTLIGLSLVLLLAACSGSSIDATYNSETCEALALKIERNDSISQEEYTAMIGQNEAILKYLVEKSREINEAPEGEHFSSWRELLANPEYMERFSYMFTIGSALYQANADGMLNDDNKKAYAELDKYNQQLAEFSDQN